MVVIVTVLIPSLQCSSSCWRRIPSTGVLLPWWQPVIHETLRYAQTNVKKCVMKSTHWETSAMCLCLRLTHRSSSSCSRTSFSRESPMPLVSYLNRKRKKKTLSETKFAYSNCKIFIVRVLLVDVVLDWQQVIAHSLEGELMQDRWHRVKCPVQDDQLWASLVWTLEKEMGEIGMKISTRTV